MDCAMTPATLSSGESVADPMLDMAEPKFPTASAACSQFFSLFLTALLYLLISFALDAFSS